VYNIYVLILTVVWNDGAAVDISVCPVIIGSSGEAPDVADVKDDPVWLAWSRLINGLLDCIAVAMIRSRMV
jgi:hypothetical protein